MNRVLIVDDNKTNRYLLRALLEAHGYAVDEACHGAEALVMARQIPPRLIISDLLMPVMDGYTLLRHWKADERLLHVPFIVYTATYINPADEKLAIDLGADAFMLKPMEPDPFVARLRELLEANERGELAAPRRPSGNETMQLEEHRDVLIRKLEAKVSALELAKQALEQSIVQRQQTDLELRQSEERFHTLVVATNEIVWLADARGEPIGDNLSWRRFTGQTVAEITGGRWAEAVHPDDRAIVLQALDRAMAERKPYKVENRLRRSDGAWRHVIARGVPILAADGTIREWIGAFEDITERREAEARVQMFSREIIAAREKERKEVSSALHHEVGSTTVGLALHFDAIEAHLRAEQPAEGLRRLQRTRKLIDELMRRFKELAVQLRPPELDVLGLSAALRQLFSRVTEHRSARIRSSETLGRMSVPEETATVLFRVVQEALTNALTHGNAQHLKVDLKAGNKEIRLTVRDDGRGFNPAAQGARAPSQLGLRVMREMTAATGGTLTIESRPGEGTVVHASLPLNVAAAAEKPTTRSAKRRSRAPKMGGA